jgi:PAS domain S-box-containing protein
MTVSVLLLIVAGLLAKQKQVSRQVADVLREVNAELEQRVKERTGALAEANERWGLVMRATNDGVWDWDVIHDRVYFTPHWKAMHGFNEQDELESSKVWSESIHPEDRARIMGKLDAYWKKQQPEFWEEYRMQRKDGTWMWVLDRGVSVWDEQGRVVRMVGAETDITWRKEAEEALGRREHEFRTLADNVPAFFSYVDRDRRYRFVNKRYEELFQRPSDQIVGLTMQELLGPEGYAVVQPHLEASLGGQEVSFEYPLAISGGGQHWFSARYVPDRDGQGRVIGLFILLGDVTTLKLSEADLRKKERTLRDLNIRLLQAQEEEQRRIAQELHDDFTQRLASLAIDLRMVQRDAQGIEPLSLLRLQQLGDLSERLATDLQKVAHRLHPSILEHVGLEAAVREQVEEFAQRTGLKAEIIVRRLPPAVPPEQALCLYRVLQESLRNVQKHADATNVLVRFLGTARGVGLCVHDDGRGIENLESSTRRKGLGLISMEERVGTLGGEFRIRTKPGDGTEIHAWVPLEVVKSES